MSSALFVGLMSGTSLDGVDAALVRLEESQMEGERLGENRTAKRRLEESQTEAGQRGENRPEENRMDGSQPGANQPQACRVELVHCHEHPLAPQLRDEIQALSHPAGQAGANEIERLGVLDRRLGQCFAQACLDLLDEAGVDRNEIKAIGCHGQTVRHRPPSNTGNGDTAFTLQLGDPNTIAEATGITTVADFRRRDIAAGGEGAPLAPAFHNAVFSQPGKRRAVVNIGGIANASLLGGLGGEKVTGFDCGPGNTLLDQWVEVHTGQHYDANGAWAAGGQVIDGLLQHLLGHPWFDLAPPRSTGKETFNLPWLREVLMGFPAVAAQDVQATLAEFTAASVCQSLALGGPAFGDSPVEEVYVCGGGAANADLMRRIQQRVAPAHVGTTTELGCDPAWVEAAAFAWLAQRRINAQPGNLSAVTGARGGRVLGAVYSG